MSSGLGRTGPRNLYDGISESTVVISEPHKMIHSGYYFNASGIKTGILNGGTLDILIKLPAGSIGHMTLVEFSADDTPLNIKFFEDVTTSDDGSTVNVRNHNRVSANDSSNATITFDPTITDTGTLLHERHIPDTGGPPGQAGGVLISGEDEEWVIGNPTSATSYLWRVTNNSGITITCGYHLNGYEVGYP